MASKLFRSLAAGAVVALAALAGTAHARDNVYWSIGIDAAPGVSVGLANTRPVVVAPAPVYVVPQPVYVTPQPVYVAPRPVMLVQSAPVYYGHPGKHKGWKKHKHRHYRHWD